RRRRQRRRRAKAEGRAPSVPGTEVSDVWTSRTVASEHDALPFHDFLNLLLAEPRLDVIGEVDHLEIDLVEDRLRPVGFILDGADRAAQQVVGADLLAGRLLRGDRKSTRLNSSHDQISYAVFCLKKK